MSRSVIAIISLVIIIFVVTVLIIAVNGGKSKSDVQPQQTTSNQFTINIKNLAFSTQQLEVSKGQEVTFTNNDSTTHIVVADDQSFDSGQIAPGKEYKKTFDTVGTFSYHCSIHPSMTGEIIVK